MIIGKEISVETCSECNVKFGTKKPETYISNYESGGYVIGIECLTFGCEHKVEYVIRSNEPLRYDLALAAMSALCEIAKASFVSGVKIRIEDTDNAEK